MNNQEKLPPIEITVEQLEEETIENLIREFVLREGTDYGANEISIDTKIQQVRRQIDRGDVKIFFEPETESINLVHKTGLGLR